MTAQLDFERPIADVRRRLEAVDKQLAASPNDDLRAERARLEEELRVKTEEIYTRLTAWQKVEVARLAQRPQTLDYAKATFTEFVELHGDRVFGDDGAIVGGPARLNGDVVMLVGHQRGRGTKEAVERNFGSPHPEGYRKALRLFRHAEKFQMPVLTFMDTSGAAPGLDDEARGQGWALAENIAAMMQLRVPIVCTVIGQGGSGGALAIGAGDRLLMLEHAIYSVSMPEAAANILYRDPKLAPELAGPLRVTAQDLRQLGLVDRIVPEPPGGAHADLAATAELLGAALHDELARLRSRPIDELVEQRYEKYRRIGAVIGG
ncbi:MAG TPA: acetyl-CoA carboxylase carboxyltransferase subunit alpha [Chloroflexota bacterium]|nr:acetyl-CoA carboxylase carboxyltransferase subunit alpha [Chloroflexota bacterium]